MPTISTLTVDVEAKTNKFKTGLKVAVGGLAALAAGAAYAFGKFEESEKVAKQTDAVLKSTGKAAHVTAKEVSDLATSLSQKSGVDDEAIQSGENMLLTFKNIRNETGKGNDIFNQAASTTLDLAASMAAASGGAVNMKTASIQMGKALNDPIKGITALSRVGVTFDDQQKKQIKTMVESGNTLGAQKLILKELTSEFAGSAAANKTATGMMSVNLENLAEAVGKVLAPAINFLLGKVSAFVMYVQNNVGPAMQAFRTWVQNVWLQIGPFMNFLGKEAVTDLKQMWAAIQPLIPQLKKWWSEYGPLVKALGALAGILLYIALNVLKVTVIGYAKFTEITLNVGGVVVGVVRTMIHAFEKFVDFFRHLPSNLKAAGSHMWDWLVDAFRGAINGVIGLWNRLAFPGFSHSFDPLGKFGPSQTVSIPGFDLPDIPTLATGGMVNRTGLAVVHEGERFSGVGGGWGVTVNVYGSVMTEQDLARSIQKALLKDKRRSGSVGLA